MCGRSPHLLSCRVMRNSQRRPMGGCDGESGHRLEQARAAGKFTSVHDAWWVAARKAHGDAAGTRALIGVLLLARHTSTGHITAGVAAAPRAGALTADAVALEAGKAAEDDPHAGHHSPPARHG
jgi:hypothetical protein